MAKRWTREWERWEDGKGWTLLVAWGGETAGDLDGTGATKKEALVNFKNKLDSLNQLAKRMKA